MLLCDRNEGGFVFKAPELVTKKFLLQKRDTTPTGGLERMSGDLSSTVNFSTSQIWFWFVYANKIYMVGKMGLFSIVWW